MRQLIGQILVDKGVITQEQLLRVLEIQRRSHRPFGEICEDLLEVRAKDVEHAWAEQYAQTTRRVDPNHEPIDPSVRDVISRRQAWQFLMLPLGYEGGELLIATTKEALVKAVNFATRQIPVPCFFVISSKEQLGEALMKHYPMEGMSVEFLCEHPELVKRA
jgi:Type II secretion system (T2SS), protein E, N-terminal domain